jgi:Phage integrase, N-terminal SAM-like domain
LVAKVREQVEEEQEEQRVYLVTEGLRSKYTKASYASAFRQFKKFINIQDERILANYKPSIIEQKVIRYIEVLAASGLKRMTIEVHKAAIFYFFEMTQSL